MKEIIFIIFSLFCCNFLCSQTIVVKMDEDHQQTISHFVKQVAKGSVATIEFELAYPADQYLILINKEPLSTETGVFTYYKELDEVGVIPFEIDVEVISSQKRYVELVRYEVVGEPSTESNQGIDIEQTVNEAFIILDKEHRVKQVEGLEMIAMVGSELKITTFLEPEFEGQFTVSVNGESLSVEEKKAIFSKTIKSHGRQIYHIQITRHDKNKEIVDLPYHFAAYIDGK